MANGLNVQGKTVYISFSAEINANTTESFIAVLGDCVNKGASGAYVMISTPGGSVMHGFNLYNVIRSLPLEVVMHNVGNVDSIGNAVFLAGVKRYACAHSTFMFHGVGHDVNQGVRLEEKNLRETLDSVLSSQKRIGSLIAQHTNIKERQIRQLFREARTKDAAYAVSCRIIHQIKDVQVPAGAPVVSLVFKR